LSAWAISFSTWRSGVIYAVTLNRDGNHWIHSSRSSISIAYSKVVMVESRMSLTHVSLWLHVGCIVSFPFCWETTSSVIQQWLLELKLIK
jgi:hypothetical protein